MDLDLAIPKEARIINGFNVGVLKVTISNPCCEGPQ